MNQTIKVGDIVRWMTDDNCIDDMDCEFILIIKHGGGWTTTTGSNHWYTGKVLYTPYERYDRTDWHFSPDLSSLWKVVA